MEQPWSLSSQERVRLRKCHPLQTLFMDIYIVCYSIPLTIMKYLEFFLILLNSHLINKDKLSKLHISFS